MRVIRRTRTESHNAGRVRRSFVFKFFNQSHLAKRDVHGVRQEKENYSRVICFSMQVRSGTFITYQARHQNKALGVQVPVHKSIHRPTTLILVGSWARKIPWQSIAEKSRKIIVYKMFSPSSRVILQLDQPNGWHTEFPNRNDNHDRREYCCYHFCRTIFLPHSYTKNSYPSGQAVGPSGRAHSHSFIDARLRNLKTWKYELTCLYRAR